MKPRDDYGPMKPYELVRPVNAGALAAMDKALYELAHPSPIPPVTRWFRLVRWCGQRRGALWHWCKWRGYAWQSFRFGLGLRVGSWIAGEDIR